jgi:uncharacterized protein YjbI with pentapeptide repeats
VLSGVRTERHRSWLKTTILRVLGRGMANKKTGVNEWHHKSPEAFRQDCWHWLSNPKKGGELSRKAQQLLLVRRGRQPFNRVERWLLTIPTWLFVSGAVLIMGTLAIQFDDGVNWDDSLGDWLAVVFENAESIAIASAVILYFKEIPDRKQQKHYEAWQVVDRAAASGNSTSYARKQALEDLNSGGVPLNGIDVPGVDLEAANLKGASLRFVDLKGASLRFSQLQNADLQFSGLEHADLYHANLKGANLGNANLDGANLEAADLEAADLLKAKLCSVNLHFGNLKGANLNYVIFWGANLQEAQLENASLLKAELHRTSLQNSNLQRTRLSWSVLNHSSLKGSDLSGANPSSVTLGRGKRNSASNRSPASQEWAFHQRD